MKFRSAFFAALILSACLALGLTGCGPIYDTAYDYDPPGSQLGAQCASNCGYTRSQCIDLEEMNYERCDANAQQEQQNCQNNLQWQGKKEKWYDCGKTSCSKDTERCESMYRDCYQSCGGKVSSRQVCVMNCSSTPPAPAPEAPAPKPAKAAKKAK